MRPSWRRYGKAGGFKAKVEELKTSGKVEVVSDGVVGLKEGEKVGGILLVLKKL